MFDLPYNIPLTDPPKSLLWMQAAAEPPQVDEDPMVQVYRDIRMSKPLEYAQLRTREETAFLAVEKAAWEVKLERERKTSGPTTQSPSRPPDEARLLVDRLLEESVCPHCGKPL